MIKIKLEDIEIGQDLFSCTSGGTLFQYKYIGNDEFLEVSSEKIHKLKLINFSLFKTKDEAIIISYKENIDILNKKVFDLEYKITKEKNKIKKLNNKFRYLKNLYPEEFI